MSTVDYIHIHADVSTADVAAQVSAITGGDATAARRGGWIDWFVRGADWLVHISETPAEIRHPGEAPVWFTIWSFDYDVMHTVTMQIVADLPARTGWRLDIDSDDEDFLVEHGWAR